MKMCCVLRSHHVESVFKSLAQVVRRVSGANRMLKIHPLKSTLPCAETLQMNVFSLQLQSLPDMRGEAGRRVLFVRCSELVQRLQAAQRDLRLAHELAKLDRFDLLVLDDLSYVRRDQAETSVLFELIAERYERKSIAITANTPFSQWGEVFVDVAMTVAAVEPLVHHLTILEMNVEASPGVGRASTRPCSRCHWRSKPSGLTRRIREGKWKQAPLAGRRAWGPVVDRRDRSQPS